MILVSLTAILSKKKLDVEYSKDVEFYQIFVKRTCTNIGIGTVIYFS